MKIFQRKWFRKQLENQSKWDDSLGYIGISSSFAIQDEAEKEKYIHTLGKKTQKLRNPSPSQKTPFWPTLDRISMQPATQMATLCAESASASFSVSPPY